MGVQYLPIDWPTYHSLAQKLAAAVLDRPTKPDKIVAVARGGLTLGHILSDLLQVPISTITIQSYADIQKQAEVTLTEKLKSSIRGKFILLVDDVADSGKTLARAVSYLRRLKPKCITTLTLFYKPHSVFRPDYFAQITTKWVIFPHEATETILSITNMLKQKGKTKQQIQRKLVSLGFSIEQIRFVRCHHAI